MVHERFSNTTEGTMRTLNTDQILNCFTSALEILADDTDDEAHRAKLVYAMEELQAWVENHRSLTTAIDDCLGGIEFKAVAR